ncbi:hypothetical protein KSP40_PGU022755 [Platanthera guangdongensis]|uniref:Uncharacterized protein n=1 Tax=Platanthera guangdongensis TaxID=2320717 RepID=A0ABR2N0Q1_9ASPA
MKIPISVPSSLPFSHPPIIKSRRPDPPSTHSSRNKLRSLSSPIPMLRRRRNALRGTVKSSDSTENAAPRDAELDKDDQRVDPNLESLFRRFWKVAAPYWSSEDKTQARLRLGAVFALTLGTTGISVGFNFLGRDFYNSLAST